MKKQFPQVCFVVGPTASGKSAYALKQAELSGAHIINCDSVQSYQEVQIGAAKPSPQEMGRVPHHLFGFVPPPHELTAGEYRRTFFDKMTDLEALGVEQVFVVGGTGFYFRAIEKGMYDVRPVDEALKAKILVELSEPGGAETLYLELKAKDPEYTKKIHVNDHYRLARAIELIRSEGVSVTEIQKRSAELKFPYPLRKLGVFVPREQLKQKIAGRVDQMLAQGLVAEVESLLKKGLVDWAPLKSVGYDEVVRYLQGELSEAEMREQIIISTNQLAKRQMTWFKADKDVEWREL